MSATDEMSVKSNAQTPGPSSCRLRGRAFCVLIFQARLWLWARKNFLTSRLEGVRTAERQRNGSPYSLGAELEGPDLGAMQDAQNANPVRCHHVSGDVGSARNYQLQGQLDRDGLDTIRWRKEAVRVVLVEDRCDTCLLRGQSPHRCSAPGKRFFCRCRGPSLTPKSEHPIFFPVFFSSPCVCEGGTNVHCGNAMVRAAHRSIPERHEPHLLICLRCS